MGTIKIEFDIPEFEKELNINVVIRRDGEVVVEQTATKPKSAEVAVKKEKPVVDDKKSFEIPSETKTQKKKSSGNLMNTEF